MTEAQEHIARVAMAFKAERDEEIESYKALYDQTPVSERKKLGLTWFPVKQVETGFSVGSFPFVRLTRNPGDKHVCKFQPGDPVSLFEEDHQTAASGIIQRVNDAEMVVVLFAEDHPEWEDERRIGVNALMDMRTFEEGEKALSLVLNAEKGRLKELREKIIGSQSPVFQDLHPIVSNRLNKSQNQAVNRILTAEDLAVVHGPPGTGKTTTLVEAAFQILKKEKQLLMCAPSNAATDHLTTQLAERGLKVLRLGNLSKIDDTLMQFTLDHKLKNENDFKEVLGLKREAMELRKKAGKFKRNFGQTEREQRRSMYREARNLVTDARNLEQFLIQKQIEEAQVITTTLVGAVHRMLDDVWFKVVIIDEAGQALEPLCWIPITRADKVILAGDPYQLPPTVKSKKAAKKGLDKTLLDLAVKKKAATVLLNTQYRMNEDIMGFSNQWFYDNQLVAHESVADHGLGDNFPAVSFIDTAGCGYDEKTGEASMSKYNFEEAQLIAKVKNELNLSADISMGVISPYREQVNVLKEVLGEHAQTDINTVDSFQGQERDVIIISMVRSNSEGDIGFLKDYRRMNVAMTRARKKLIIVGDSATIGQDKFYAALLEHCELKGFYRSAWELIY